ncbi:hypothetical protein JN535_04830 [Cellulosimicrobium cellulans]|uniref:hypothetical protein n=1 Tax=Cellulosimicrobium cellulans TaxID=1710 RepID=UPI001962CD09|nr:hypothetical protein [Cellulosimicrobium cellulans]MBN0039500.1 hypothetical protein [Cellulosimicrobium cellulans]
MTSHGAAPRPGTTALLARALALGVAAGSRSSLGVAAPVLAGWVAGGSRDGSGGPGLLARAGAAAGVVGEMVGDKLPQTPSRLAGPGPVFRLGSGAVGGVLLARRRTGPAGLVAAAAAGAAGAAVGTWGGAAWRRLAVGSRPDWPGAVAEDAVALTLAAWAVRR